MRVAIVGSGVSGLVAAHLLHPSLEITVFEARERIGGHVNTIRVGDSSGEWDVDTGFIVYNVENYPLFSGLLAKLGVPTQPTDMSFSVRCDRTGLEYNGSTLRQLFVQKRNLLSPRYVRMIRDIVRFNREAPMAVANEPEMSLGQYLETAGYSSRLTEHYIGPMGSALWSMPRQKVLEMPAAFFVNFFDNHRMLTVNDRPEWRVVQGGSERYVEALIKPFRDRIRTSAKVDSVRRVHGMVFVNGEPFDAVVLACHSDQALKALDDPTQQEINVLGAMSYQTNEVVLHTDTTVLPRRTRAWGAWNYHISGAEDRPAAVSYNMNILQSLNSQETFCVTLNPTVAISSDRVLYRTTFDHPVFTSEAIDAQKQRSTISGVDNTYYCGAYWGYGFHEDGVRSALAVADAVGVGV